MTRKRRPQGDLIEHEIELALNPGAFIPYGASFSFVSELDEIAAKIAKLISSDPARAVTLYETFLAACYLKIMDQDQAPGARRPPPQEQLHAGIRTSGRGNWGPSDEPSFLELAKTRWNAKERRTR